MEKNSRFPVQWKDGRMEGRRKERNIAVWRRIVGSLCSGRMEGWKVEGRRGIQLYGEEQQVPCVVEGWKERRQERNIVVWRRIVGSLCSGRIEDRRQQRNIYIYGEKYQVPCVVEGQKVGEEYIYMEKNTRFPVQWKDRRQERNIFIYGEEQQVPSSGRIEGWRGIYIYGEEYQIPCIAEGCRMKTGW